MKNFKHSPLLNSEERIDFRVEKPKKRPRSSMEQERHASNVRVTGSSPVGVTRYKVFIQDWEESERGWGVRPDGASLHLNLDDVTEYIKAHCADRTGPAPDEYDRPDGSPYEFHVTKEVYDKITSSKNKFGIRVWCSELREIKK